LTGNGLVAVDPNELAFDGLPVAKILVLTATPEPGTLGVVASAAVVLWIRAARRRPGRRPQSRRTRPPYFRLRLGAGGGRSVASRSVVFRI
ncbi:MAG: hypothetical protein ACRD8O_06420, partial [Bryobacteraceae bacterium]